MMTEFMYCHNCGKQIMADAKYCRYCGIKIESQSQDLVAQKAEILDISGNIVINNDDLIEKSAQWQGDEFPQFKSLTVLSTNDPIGKIDPETTYQTINSNLKLQIQSYKGTDYNYSTYCLTDENNHTLSKRYEYMAPLPPSFDKKRYRNIKWCKVGNEDKYGLMILHLYKDKKPKIQEIPCIFENVDIPYEVNNETVYIDGHPFHVKSKFATNVKYNSSNCILLLPSGKLYCVEKRESILVWGMALFISLAVVLIAALVIGLLDAFFLPIPVEMRLLIMIGCGIISFLIVAMGMASVKELCEIKY